MFADLPQPFFPIDTSWTSWQRSPTVPQPRLLQSLSPRSARSPCAARPRPSTLCQRTHPASRRLVSDRHLQDVQDVRDVQDVQGEDATRTLPCPLHGYISGRRVMVSRCGMTLASACTPARQRTSAPGNMGQCDRCSLLHDARDTATPAATVRDPFSATATVRHHRYSEDAKTRDTHLFSPPNPPRALCAPRPGIHRAQAISPTRTGY